MTEMQPQFILDVCLRRGGRPHRRLERQICVETAHAVHNGRALTTVEPCPRGLLRICVAPAAWKTEIPSRCPASAQTGPSAADSGGPVPISSGALLQIHNQDQSRLGTRSDAARDARDAS